jgi:hypothetical protein
MSRFRNGIFLFELLLLVALLICCNFGLKYFCIVIIGVLLILEGLVFYLNRQIKQVIDYCKIKALLVEQQKFEEADKLTSSLTDLQKYILEDIKK